MIRKRTKHEEHQVSHDRYLITYADLITLLLGLFVILYASSQVDSAKYKEFSQAMGNYFESGKADQKGDGILPGQQGIPQPILPTSSEKTLDQISQDLERSLAGQIASGNIGIKRTADGIAIDVSEKLLFQSAKSEVQAQAYSVLDSLSGVLRGIKQQIQIQGHTDSIPIRTFQFESNWHLSVGRALSVAWYCIRSGVPEPNISVIGYGSQRPIADNATPQGRMLNRRVEILIKELPQNVPSTDGYVSKDSAVSKPKIPAQNSSQ